MSEVFHVARRSSEHHPSHAPGTVLGLVPISPCTYPGALDAARERFPGGVSSHGSQYLVRWPGNHQPGWAAEAVFEAIRLAEHPDKPSRMISCFACETVEDARAFIASFRQDSFVDVWRAEALSGIAATWVYSTL